MEPQDIQFNAQGLGRERPKIETRVQGGFLAREWSGVYRLVERTDSSWTGADGLAGWYVVRGELGF